MSVVFSDGLNFISANMEDNYALQYYKCYKYIINIKPAAIPIQFVLHTYEVVTESRFAIITGNKVTRLCLHICIFEKCLVQRWQ